MYYFNRISSVKPRKNIVHEDVKKPEQPKVQTQSDKEISHAAKYMIGAMALAATVAFGIIAHKRIKSNALKKLKNELHDLPRPQSAKPVPKQVEVPEMKPTENAKRIYNKTDEKLHATNPINAETIDNNIFKTTQNNKNGWSADDIKDYYAKLEKESAKAALEEQRAERIVRHRKALFRPEDKHVQSQGKPFNTEESLAVGSYQDNYSYNSGLRDGEIIPEKIKEIRIMDKIAQEAPPLPDDAVVYRGIRTKVWYEPERKLPIADKIKKGAILEDPSYVSTARQDGRLLSHFNPIENPSIGCEDTPIGYMMRIKLPKGSKVIDCSRGGIYNDEIILPRNSKIKINDIDETNHILECEYLLP